MAISGERIRQVRELRRLTQRQLADLAGIGQSAISQIESGFTQPSATVTEAIAVATGFPLDFFSREAGPEFPAGSLLFRARRSATSSELTEAYRWAELVYECASTLAARLELIPVLLPQLGGETPTAAARLTRSALGLSPDRPVSNLTYALEHHGVLVLAIPIQLEKRDAFSMWVGNRAETPLINVSAGLPGDRLRFSLAHETGHLVMHPSQRGYIRDLERQADEFAGEFLLPADALHNELPSPVTIEGLFPLKRRWGVSIQTLIMRAKTLGVISQRRCQHLFKILAQRGQLRREPRHLDIPLEKPRAFRKMAEVVYGNPLDPRKLASEFSLPLQLAVAIVGVHAKRSEMISTVPDSREASNIVEFHRR